MEAEIGALPLPGREHQGCWKRQRRILLDRFQRDLDFATTLISDFWPLGLERINEVLVFVFLLWPHLGHIELLGPGIESEPQLLPMLSCSSSRHSDPLRWSGDGTCASAVTRAAAARFLTHCTLAGTPNVWGFKPPNLSSYIGAALENEHRHK